MMQIPQSAIDGAAGWILDSQREIAAEQIRQAACAQRDAARAQMRIMTDEVWAIIGQAEREMAEALRSIERPTKIRKQSIIARIVKTIMGR